MARQPNTKIYIPVTYYNTGDKGNVQKACREKTTGLRQKIKNYNETGFLNGDERSQKTIRKCKKVNFGGELNFNL